MTPRRVALIGLPALMEDLVRRACAAEPGFVVGGMLADLSQLRTELRQHRIDVVIAGVPGEPQSQLPIAVFEAQPEARVLLIETHEAAADLYELLPQRRRLGPVSPVEIVRALQDDAARSQKWSMLRRETPAPLA